MVFLRGTISRRIRASRGDSMGITRNANDFLYVTTFTSALRSGIEMGEVQRVWNSFADKPETRCGEIGHGCLANVVRKLKDADCSFIIVVLV